MDFSEKLIWKISLENSNKKKSEGGQGVLPLGCLPLWGREGVTLINKLKRGIVYAISSIGSIPRQKLIFNPNDNTIPLILITGTSPVPAGNQPVPAPASPQPRAQYEEQCRDHDDPPLKYRPLRRPWSGFAGLWRLTGLV